MSNPTVFELNKSIIRNNILFIEDNIGESIHFHIGLVRFDLSIEEFYAISQKLIKILAEQVQVDNFDLTIQNEYFLERIATSIPYITSVIEDTVDVKGLKCRIEDDKGKILETNIINTPVYKYYAGLSNSINEYIFKREIWQSKKEMLEIARANPSNDIYIDQDNFILDGYKGICAMLVSSLINKRVPVKRMSFSNNKKPIVILTREKKEW